MNNHDVYGNLNMSNLSYLLDPEAAGKESAEAKGAVGEDEDTLLPLSKLVAFKDHPFEVEMDDENFLQLVDSIKENGLIYPILVRPAGEQYEIIAGHRRVAASKEAGLDEIPAIIREMDDYEATILMVHSNFYRDKIKISEKAKAYRMCMDAEKHQGKKGQHSAELIGNGQDSKRQVYRYIRLSYLLDVFLGMLDEGKIPVNTGLEIAYLDDVSQEAVMGYITDTGKIPNTAQAAALRKMYEEGQESLSKEKVIAVLCIPEKPKAAGKITFKARELEDYFEPGTDPEDMSQVILMLLDKYREGVFDGMI